MATYNNISADIICCSAFCFRWSDMAQLNTPTQALVSSLSSTPMADVEMFNHSLCIICQKDDKTPFKSAPTGRNNVKWAAEICSDIVARHLRSIAMESGSPRDSDTFVYHNTNKCYPCHQTQINPSKKSSNRRKLSIWAKLLFKSYRIWNPFNW